MYHFSNILMKSLTDNYKVYPSERLHSSPMLSGVRGFFEVVDELTNKSFCLHSSKELAQWTIDITTQINMC